jgi:transposase-like protein
MAQLSLSEVSKRFGVNRSTIYRSVSTGKLSRLDNGMFDLAEVLRVFGEPSAPVKQSVEPSASNANDREVISILKSQVELLTKQLEQKDSQIDHLQRLLVAPETSTQHPKATLRDNAPQQDEMPIDQDLQQDSSTMQRTLEANSNDTKQHGATLQNDVIETIKKPTLVGRFGRGLKAFLNN